MATEVFHKFNAFFFQFPPKLDMPVITGSDDETSSKIRTRRKLFINRKKNNMEVSEI